MKGDGLGLTPDPAFHPCSAERWGDLERLFGARGAYSGCWCMWWRLTRAEFSRTPAAERRLLLKDLVDRGEAPGILAYVDGEPVGWCSLGPRESFPALERSRTLKRIDDRDVWSIVCFFVAKEWRGQGLMKTLIDAGVAYAGSRGATAVEAYPSAPAGRERNTGFAIYMGVVGAFVRAGFVEVAHPGSRQYIMRRGV